jgi:hypothetical protein
MSCSIVSGLSFTIYVKTRKFEKQIIVENLFLNFADVYLYLFNQVKWPKYESKKKLISFKGVIGRDYPTIDIWNGIVSFFKFCRHWFFVRRQKDQPQGGTTVLYTHNCGKKEAFGGPLGMCWEERKSLGRKSRRRLVADAQCPAWKTVGRFCHKNIWLFFLF